ncbi:MAG: hypothetical protein KC457_36675, partial [Myxococcales bacterium]|nr:hypothetical protein [Myxococcales bacterium]
CHRLAFIFRGRVLDTGAPEEIIARRRLSVAEVVVDDTAKATAALDEHADVDECAHFGAILRVATRSPDALGLVRAVLERAGVTIRSVRETRATVEDAFVSMVREEASS